VSLGVSVAPPRDEHELRVRAFGLEGRSVASLAASVGMVLPPVGASSKGKVGELLERALGATGGSRAAHDFPELGIELKTLPVDVRGVARESTYVCRASFDAVETLTWERSWVRAKLAHVLWIPVVTPEKASPWAERRIGTPFFWEPSAAEEALLADDFAEILGTAAVAGVEAVSARRGKLLQLRPKAATGSARARTVSEEGDESSSVPRGFYLRATFTSGLLASLSAGTRVSR
jgi:DNA mismatch repair protein MutH